MSPPIGKTFQRFLTWSNKHVSLSSRLTAYRLGCFFIPVHWDIFCVVLQAVGVLPRLRIMIIIVSCSIGNQSLGNIGQQPFMKITTMLHNEKDYYVQ